ncbi:hypothetical protein UT300012_21510 [Paraclostridium bifermentans]
MGKVLNFMRLRNKRDYDFERIADILCRKKLESKKDKDMLKLFLKDITNLEGNPKLMEDVWNGLAYRYVKRGKVFVNSERELEKGETIEDLLLGSFVSRTDYMSSSKYKYLVRVEAEYMEISKLIYDIGSLDPELFSYANCGSEFALIAGYFRMETAKLMDIKSALIDPYSLVIKFVNNVYREDKAKENMVYYIIANSLYYLHSLREPADISYHRSILKNLRDYFRLPRYIDNDVKGSESHCNISGCYYIKSEGHNECEILHEVINTTLLLHDLLLALDMIEVAKVYDNQRPIYMMCEGIPERLQVDDAF